MAYDLDLQASPLSLTTLARSYPKLPLRGTFSGPIGVRGIAPDLQVEADLTGPAGHITYAGRVDADSHRRLRRARQRGVRQPERRGARRAWRPRRRGSRGATTSDITGDSLATLAGSLAPPPRALGGGRRAARERRVAAALRRRGVLHVDTLHVNATPGTLRAHGTLGLTRPAGSRFARARGGRRFARRASPVLQVDLRVDRRAGARLAARIARIPAAAVRGWLDSLDVARRPQGARAVRERQPHACHDRLARGAQRERPHHWRTWTCAPTPWLRRGSACGAPPCMRGSLDKGRARFGAGAATNNGGSLRDRGRLQRTR